MVKDLRTRSVTLRIGKCQQLTSEEESQWGLYQTQTFLPSLETLFKTESLQSSAPLYGIKVSDPLQAVLSPSRLRTHTGKHVDIHRKTTCILNPFRWMRGDYGSLGLPASSETAAEIQTKLQSPHTAAYVGALASIVLSESECPNFPTVYGVYCGMARKHRVDISDDYEDLTERPWFAQNIGKTYELSMRRTIASPSFHHTRGERPLVETGDTVSLGDLPELEGNELHEDVHNRELEQEEMLDGETLSEDDDDSSSASTDDVYEIESCDCSSQGSFVEDEGGDEPEAFVWAELTNVPVVTTVMEQCEGTLYKLLSDDADADHHIAYLAQVVFALAYAQRTFGFVHNDLHGNNVMYVATDKTHLSYTLDGTCYRVPTYGKLIKIIDFDRAIFSVRVAGMRDPKLFMSDQFHEDEEAAGQYNMEPFYNSKVAEIKANPSFDLVRLATSLFWDMFPEGPAVSSNHPLKLTLIRWMTLPDQTSILFGHQNPKHDRYHGFMQYKAIARYCKDTAVPRREPLLQQFHVDKLPLGEPVIPIEP